MAKKKTVKCRYKYCKHDSQDIPREEAIGVGSLYFHADCLQERNNKEEIIKKFLQDINPDIPVAQLRRVVNDIIHKKGINSEFLLFALSHNNGKLRYPGGLYYLISDQKILDEYNRYKNRSFEFNLDGDNSSQSFTYTKPKKKTLDNFMEG